MRRSAWALLVLLCLAIAPGTSARAQAPAPAVSTVPSSDETRASTIALADIPARADADEKFVQMLQRRTQASAKVQGFEQALTRQAAALRQLTELTQTGELSDLSVQRLETLERHWLLNERAVTQTRTELARTTNASSEDAASLARRRAAWQATVAEPDLSPALLQRANELIAQIEQAQAKLAAPLAALLDLGRKGNALQAQLQDGLSEVSAQVADQDRRLVTMDSLPMWQAASEPNRLDPWSAGLRRSLDIETAFARDYDAAHVRLRLGLMALGLLLLPLMFWLKRRANLLVAAGQLGEPARLALARPWAAWLLLVAAIAVLYDVQGPHLRQQLVMLLAWIPVFGLLQRRILSVVGPWAYLSAVFYFLNVMVSLLIASPMLLRFALLAITLLMLLPLAWHVQRSRRVVVESDNPLQTRLWNLLRWLACAVLVAAAASNILGNVSLAAMLVSATLDSSYAALAMLAGSKVLLALFQVLLAGPTVSRLAARYSASLVPSVVSLGRNLLVLGWLIFTLQAFRIYRPLSTFLLSVLTHEFKLGELTLSLGSVVSFAVATWAAFWLARTIRQVLAEDVLPALSLPRGVGSSISSLSYYSILFLGLLAALAAAGFQVGQLTIIFGALGVGIGIGLQDVVRNFVSGLILMFERPIQRGDTVEVAGMEGTVREIGLRATIVTTFDGADVVVPNGMLLADKLVNWTLNGTRRRVTMNVSTGFSAAPQRTIEVLLAIARGVNGVAQMPAPAVIMTGMAPGELLFNVRVWTTDFSDWIDVRTELTMKIRDGLAEAGIEVPKPQRELIVRGLTPQAAQQLGQA
ncbi:MAG: mechanosensitive ion channel family protein, partial [Rubrivivax sp.]